MNFNSNLYKTLIKSKARLIDDWDYDGSCLWLIFIHNVYYIILAKEHDDFSNVDLLSYENALLMTTGQANSWVLSHKSYLHINKRNQVDTLSSLLRDKWFLKHSKEFDLSIINEPDFTKIIFHMVNSCYNKNKYTFIKNSYEREDLLTFVTLYAIQYTATTDIPKSKIYYGQMCNLISQKISRLVMKLKEKEELVLSESNQFLDYISDDLNINEETNKSIVIDKIFEYNNIIKKSSNCIQASKARRHLKEYKNELSIINNKYSQCKKELTKNLSKYTKQLLYYSNSNAVCEDISKEAKKILKKVKKNG